jgi:beta-1,4-mannosyltransferase
MPTLMAWPAGGAPGSNPYQTLLYRELSGLGWQVVDFEPGRLLKQPPDLLHIHWPDLVLLERRGALRVAKTLAFLVLFAVVRARGRTIVWTVHNPGLREEQHSRWGLIYLSLLMRLCSGLILLAPEHRGEFGGPQAVVPQPHYRDVYGPGRDRGEAKGRLGLQEGEPVLGFFGKVRPYKNLEGLLSSFQQMDDERPRLLVAGEVDPSCAGLVPMLRATQHVTLFDGFVEDSEVAWLLGSMDVVVLPYRELGNSAVALLALSYDRPVLGPAVASSLRELQREVGDAWVQLYDGELSAADLEDTLQRVPAPGSRPALGSFSPDRVGRLTDRFFRELLGSAGCSHSGGTGRRTAL